MDEAERLCDRIVIIDGGRILDQGRPRELIERHVCRHVFEIPKPMPEGLLANGLDHEDIGDAVLFYVERPEQVTGLVANGGTYFHRPANLEDVFLRLTGRQLRDAL